MLEDILKICLGFEKIQSTNSCSYFKSVFIVNSEIFAASTGCFGGDERLSGVLAHFFFINNSGEPYYLLKGEKCSTNKSSSMDAAIYSDALHLLSQRSFSQDRKW